MALININSSAIYLFGTVKGLHYETRSINKIMNKWKPDSLALAVSRESLTALNDYGDSTEEPFLSDLELVYQERLSSFGEVSAPPPSFIEIVRYGKEKGLPVYALDFDEETYSQAFCDSVSFFQWVGHYNSSKIKKLARHKFRAKTPHEFIIEWDKLSNNTKGLRELEKKRERYMARNVNFLIKKHERIFAIVDLERLEGIEQFFKNGLKN